MLFAKVAHGSREIVAVKQVGHADAAARSFVLIAGADAARSGADRNLARNGFADFFDKPVSRQQNLAAIADAELVCDVDSGFGQLADLFEQGERVDHEPVADDGDFAGVQNTAGDQAKDEFPVADLYGVAGVVAALKPNDVVVSAGEQIDELSFAFVAPLCAEDDDIGQRGYCNALCYAGLLCSFQACFCNSAKNACRNCCAVFRSAN